MMTPIFVAAAVMVIVGELSAVALAASAAERFGETEVQYLHRAVVLHLDVGWFEVAVDDPLLVRRFEGFRDLASYGERLVERDRALGDAVLERGARNVFEDEGRRVTAFLQPMNRRDVRMVERGQHLRFTLEASQPLGVVHEGVGQDLQRDITIQLRVPRLVDLPHAARAELFGDHVLPELAA